MHLRTGIGLRQTRQFVREVCDRRWTTANGRRKWKLFEFHTPESYDDIVAEEPEVCIAGEVLRGLKRPPQCAAFGTTCTPDRPLGAPMVSSEGACAAYHRFRNGGATRATATRHEAVAT